MLLADLAVGTTAARSSPRRARSCAASWRGSPSAGCSANAGTELEFIVFNDTYEEAWKKGYRDLEPANLYNIDYSLLGSARVEPLIRRIRNEMAAAGMTVENSKGECNLGQHEINFRYGEALRRADDHAIYKNGAKEIAAQEGMSITFMAKFNEREGNSCHIHCSLADARTARTPSRADQAAVRPLPRRPARLHARADAVLRAPRQLLQALRAEARSRRPRSPGAATTAPARCGSSATAQALRVENRLPGADVNPYLALSAMIAAGLHGIDNELTLEPAARGQRLRVRQARACPTTSTTPATCSRAARSPARRSARRSSTTT